MPFLFAERSKTLPPFHNNSAAEIFLLQTQICNEKRDKMRKSLKKSVIKSILTIISKIGLQKYIFDLF